MLDRKICYLMYNPAEMLSVFNEQDVVNILTTVKKRLEWVEPNTVFHIGRGIPQIDYPMLYIVSTNYSIDTMEELIQIVKLEEYFYIHSYLCILSELRRMV